MMKLLLTAISAALLGMAIFSLSQAAFESLTVRGTARRLEDFLGERGEEKGKRFFFSLLREEDMLLLSILEDVGFMRFLPYMMLGGFIIALVGIALRSFFLIPAGILLALYPPIKVRGRVKDLKEKVVGEIPALASLLSAFLVTLAAEEAITRAKDAPGCIGEFLNYLIASAKRSPKPLFGRGETGGALLEEARKFNLEPVTAFFAQLDGIARAGTGGAEMMKALAASLHAERRIKLSENMEKLDNNLVLPMMVFFFIPFLGGIMLPILIGLLEQL
ncbi:MAG: hypothetical protein QW687_00890 [Candidatus Hadarchaeales archaeon]